MEEAIIRWAVPLISSVNFIITTQAILIKNYLAFSVIILKTQKIAKTSWKFRNFTAHYVQGKIYTYVANILIAVNPYTNIADLYSQNTIRYHIVVIIYYMPRK